MICDCQCEHSGSTYEHDSPKCNHHGDLKCGECFCNEGWNGTACECRTDYFELNSSKCNHNGGLKCDKCCQRNKECPIPTCTLIIILLIVIILLLIIVSLLLLWKLLKPTK